MTKMKTKAELVVEVEELREALRESEEKLQQATLAEEAISDCRRMLERIGHSGTYFDDVVADAVQEIKALRYDKSQHESLTRKLWHFPSGVRVEKPKRDGTEPRAFVATVDWQGLDSPGDAG